MAYQAATYDEAKANPYPNLPDPLVFNNGKKVTTAAQWRRAGPRSSSSSIARSTAAVPKVTPKVTWTVASTTNDTVAGIPVITKKLVGHVDNSSYPPLTVNIIASLTVRPTRRARCRSCSAAAVTPGPGGRDADHGRAAVRAAPAAGGAAARAADLVRARVVRAPAAAPVDPPANEQILSVAGATPRSTPAASRPTTAAV